MARAIKQGQSIYLPFINGESVFDSQNRPRMYKTVEQFKKSYPAFRLQKPVLVEYAPVVYSAFEGITIDDPAVEWGFCKRCGEYVQVLHFCPNCGAKMDL